MTQLLTPDLCVIGAGAGGLAVAAGAAQLGAAANSAFDGTQPKLRQSPPIFPRSTSTGTPATSFSTSAPTFSGRLLTDRTVSKAKLFWAAS